MTRAPARMGETGERNGSAGPAVLAVVGTVFMLSIVALGSRTGAFSTQSNDGGAGLALWEYGLPLLAIFLAICGTVALLLILSVLVDARMRVPEWDLNVLGIVLMAALFIGVAISVRVVEPGGNTRPQERPVSQDGTVPTDEEPSAKGGKERQSSNRSSVSRTALIAFSCGAGLGALGFGAYWLLRGPRQRYRDDELAVKLGNVLDKTLDDLRAETDPRRAVIAAYARVEVLLASVGLPRRPAEAPVEYLERASTTFRKQHYELSLRLLGELTHLFERAKFSSHRIDQGMKNEAIESLEAIRAELAEGAA
jgi:hypothetical protein